MPELTSPAGSGAATALLSLGAASPLALCLAWLLGDERCHINAGQQRTRASHGLAVAPLWRRPESSAPAARSFLPML